MTSPAGNVMPPGLGGIITPEQWDGYIAAQQKGINEAQGYQREALKAQMSSAQAARKNAMEIAQLQAHTSRYGIDAQTATALADRVEKARQFDADHGLDIAKAYTAFSSTPDMMFARTDFMNAMGRVGQGLTPSPYMSQGQPHAKTWEDFSSIAQYNGSTIPGAASGGGGGGGVGGSASGGGGGGAAAAPPDPRLTAASAVMKALPPSETQGHDDNDYAALSAIRSLYQSGNPAMQKLGAQRMKIAQAGMARLGYNERLIAEEYERGLPHQQSPLLA